MCGILMQYKVNGFDQKDLEYALSALKAIDHRGPDGEGIMMINSRTGVHKLLRTDKTPKELTTFESDSIDLKEYDLLFAHKRLSIFDLSANGFQPMVNDSNGDIIIFNGEIYNFPELKM
jgi:asparagine synthase (glutamine-hydrolysing)